MRITLDNFGPRSYSAAIDLKRINFVVGPPMAGKTSFLHVIKRRWESQEGAEGPSTKALKGMPGNATFITQAKTALVGPSSQEVNLSRGTDIVKTLWSLLSPLSDVKTDQIKEWAFKDTKGLTIRIQNLGNLIQALNEDGISTTAQERTLAGLQEEKAEIEAKRKIAKSELNEHWPEVLNRLKNKGGEHASRLQPKLELAEIKTSGRTTKATFEGTAAQLDKLSEGGQSAYRLGLWFRLASAEKLKGRPIMTILDDRDLAGLHGEARKEAVTEAIIWTQTHSNRILIVSKQTEEGAPFSTPLTKGEIKTVVFRKTGIQQGISNSA